MSETITCEWCAEEIPAGSGRCPMCQGSISPTGRRIQGTPLAAKPAEPARPKAPAGWYDDPKLVNTRRYWDGAKWTEHRQEKVPAPPVVAAAQPPADHPEDSPRSRGGWIGAAVVVLVIVVIGALSGGNGGSDGPDTGDKYGAQDVCKQFVKKRLKSPGSADFSETSTTGSGQLWTVSGAVDSQNTFGGLVRNNYVCKVRHTAGENWRLVDMQMTGN